MADVASPRPWWSELSAVVPRSVAFARRAARPERDATSPPPLAGNALAWATVALDEFAVSAAYLLTRRSAEEVSEQSQENAAEALRLLRDAGVVDEPVRAHPEPAGPAAQRLTRRHRLGLDFEHLSFTSDYRPPVPLPGVDGWADDAGNTRAHAYLLRGGRADRPCVVVLHGHRMGEPRDLRLLGSLRLHRDLDVDVAHLVLPMHGPRGRDRRSHPFPGLDPVANFLGMAQAVSDTRALLAWLRGRGATRLGLFGVSLGGHVAAMVAGLDASLDCVVAGVPTSDVATMLADTMRARWGEEAVAASHVDDESFRGLSRLVSPLAFPARLPVDRRHLYAAVGDRLVTPQQALALWHHWERCSILWLQGGHIANNVGASRRFVTDALAAGGVTGR